MNSGASEQLAPVEANERVETLDILRGFALLGILLVNFWGSPGEIMPAVDNAMNEVLEVLISSSFYPLFSFLFGLGFAVQLLRARERNTPIANVYVRRLLALFLIGSFHAVLIWDGDILVEYSLFGFLLVVLYRLRDRWLIPIAVALLLVSTLGSTARTFVAQLQPGAGPQVTELQRVASDERTRITNNITDRDNTRAQAWTADVSVRWRTYAQTVRGFGRIERLLSDIVMCFIIGLIIGRRRIIQDAIHHGRALKIAAAIGFIGCVAGNIVIYRIEPARGSLASSLAWTGADLGPTIFYIAAITLGVTRWRSFARAFRIFAAPGRIGLTNYLMQSVIMTSLFYGYGVFREEPPTTLWVVINLMFFFAVQVPFSRWWIARYRFGPAEWVWRSLTYGETQPFRLPEPTPVAREPELVSAG